MKENRQRLYRTPGVIIRRINLGEADRILTLYTPRQGKVRAVAKGVRRPGSRLAGHVELLSHSSFLVARGRNLDIITQAQTLHAFPDLRQRLDRISWGFLVAELLDRLTPEEMENEALYDLLLETLDQLDRGENPEITARYFELHLLGYLGYRPQVFRCVHCERDLQPQDQAFSTTLGGILCPQCRNQDRQARPLSLEALKTLRYLLRNSLSEVQRLHLGEACRQEVEQVLQTYTRVIAERELNAVGFLEMLRRDHLL